VATQAAADPGSHGAPTPPIPARSWSGDGSTQILLLLFREQCGTGPGVVSPISDTVGAMDIVAAGNLANPVGGSSLSSQQSPLL